MSRNQLVPKIQNGEVTVRRKRDKQREKSKELRVKTLVKKEKPESIKLASLFEKNCLTCRKFTKCKNKKKRFNYACDEYKKLKPRTEEKEIKKEVATKPKETPFIVKKRFLKQDTKLTEAALSDREFKNIIDKALQEFQTTQLPPDILIDDRDLPLARNVVEFCSRDFLNTELFAKQYQVALHVCADFCPNPKCTDLKYVFDIPLKAKIDDILERVTVFNYGVCPRCKGRRSEFYNAGKLKVPFEFAGLVGQRAGKSAVVKVLLPYTYHRFLKLPNPAHVFGCLPEEILNSYLIGLTFSKAKTLLFDGVHNYLKKAPWFQKYNEFLDFHGTRMGEQLYSIKEIMITYRHRNLAISPQGPDMRKNRGITAFASAIDELGWFINSASARGITGEGGQAIKINADEVYTSVSNAFAGMRASFRRLLESGRDNIPPPLLLNISSPSSKKDKIVSLYKESRNSEDIWGCHYATWEFNPTITRKDLNGKFNSNYAKALRDFGAVPPNSSLPYIEKMKQIKPLCNPGVFNNLSYRPSIVSLQSGVSKLTGRVIFRKNETNIPHIMCFDAGYSHNSFSIVTGYYDTKQDLPVFDGFLEVIPSADTPISFTAMLDDIMAPIIEKMNVKFVASDRWQNLKFFSDIEDMFEIETGQFPLKYSSFLEFKEDVDKVAMFMPMPEVKFKDIDALTSNDYPNSFLYKPVSHVISQMLTVQDVQKDVIKGPELTDDIFRAMVLAHSYLTDPEYQDLFMSLGEVEMVKRAIGAVGKNTGGGSAGRSINGIGVSVSRGR